MDCTVHGVPKSQIRLSDFHFLKDKYNCDKLGDETRIFQLQNCELRFLKTHADQSTSVKKQNRGETIAGEGIEESMEGNLYAFKFELDSGITILNKMV